MYGSKKMCAVCLVVYILIIVGALNWGLVGAGWLFGGGADWNVVHKLLGKWMQVEAVVYLLVGLAGLYKLFLYGKCCGKHACGNCGSGDCKGCCSCGNPNCNGNCQPKP